MAFTSIRFIQMAQSSRRAEETADYLSQFAAEQPKTNRYHQAASSPEHRNLSSQHT